MTEDANQPGYRSSIDSPISEPWWNRFLETYHPRPKTMLDIGTGLGRYARWFAKQGFKTTGIDKDAGRLKQAKTLPNGDRVTFLHGDIAELTGLNLGKESFGLIVDRQSSQFLSAEQQPLYFDMVTELLAPTGIFYYGIVEPSGPNPPELATRIGISIQEAVRLVEKRFDIVKRFEQSSTNLPGMRTVEVVAKPKA